MATTAKLFSKGDTRYSLETARSFAGQLGDSQVPARAVATVVSRRFVTDLGQKHRSQAWARFYHEYSLESYASREQSLESGGRSSAVRVTHNLPLRVTQAVPWSRGSRWLFPSLDRRYTGSRLTGYYLDRGGMIPQVPVDISAV